MKIANTLKDGGRIKDLEFTNESGKYIVNKLIIKHNILLECIFVVF